VALFARSFTTQQINTRHLCVSDASGAQTCITKERLDALLSKVAQSEAVEPSNAQAVGSEAPATSAETNVSTLAEPATADREHTSDQDPAVSQTAVATTPIVELPGSGSKVEQSADFNPAGETSVVIASEPAAIPAEDAQDDSARRNQEPTAIDSVTIGPWRDAGSYPKAEISSPGTASVPDR
jgi:hypothetical protein